MDQGFVWPCSFCAVVAFGLFALGFLVQALLRHREIPTWVRWLFDAFCVVILLGIGIRPLLGFGGDIGDIWVQILSALVMVVVVETLMRAGGLFARRLLVKRDAEDRLDP